jgi:hypothetical protein
MAAATARGQFFYAATPDDLDAVFDEIIRRTSCRDQKLYLPIILKDARF